MKYIKLLLLVLLLAEVQTTFGQGWVVSGNYTYDMTVTAVLNVNCTELSNPSNKVGAFINGEVRGTALSSTVVKGRYVALLTIHSNVASSESVSFKIYNAVTGDIIDASTKVVFQDDAVYGTPSDPYEIRTNSVPSNLSLTTKTVQESNAATLISVINVSDADVTDSHIYTLVTGAGSTDNSKFTITGNQLYSTGALYYDDQSKYKIRIKADDNRGCSVSDSFTISLTDRNFPSTDILLSSDNIDENKAVASIIGTFTSVDQDKADTFIYTLVSGTGADDNSKFSISGNALRTNVVFDYETKASYKIRVQTKDAANNLFEKAFVITINNANDKPLINDKTMAVDEHAAAGKVVGIITGTDADVNQTLTYSFYSPINPPQAIFGINASTGEVSLLSSTLNYKTTQSYTLKVVALDNGNPAFSDTAALTILVLYQNFPPTDLYVSNKNIKENITVGTKIAELGTYDKNTDDTFTYSLIDGDNATDNGSFIITGNGLYTNGIFDYESKMSYNIRIQTKDFAGSTFQKAFVINVTDVNEKPDLHDQIMIVEEDAVAGTIVGTMDVTDPDLYQLRSFYFVNEGTPQNDFKIDIETGEVSLLTSNLNYTVRQSYSIKVAVWDKGVPALSDTAMLLINVHDKNYEPTELSISNDNIDENEPANTMVALFSTADVDVGETFTYTLVSGVGSSDNSKFILDGNKLRAKSSFNYETKASYDIRVQTKDSGEHILQQTFTIVINDLNDKPKLNNQTVGIEENTTRGNIVCKMQALDEDVNQHITYTFIDASVQSPFRIDPVTGEVTLISTVLDYEKVKLYTFQVAAVDDGNPILSDTATLVINVLDVVEGTLASVDYLSPNGDGKNDYWLIENVELYAAYTLMIFDANGIMVYKVDSDYDNSWNGIYKGSQLPIGAYYYVLSDNNGSNSFKGTITLVR